MSIIYRGYKVVQHNGVWIVLDKDEKAVFESATEDRAYTFIDGEKAIEHKRK